MKVRFIPILILLLCIYNNIPAMEQQPPALSSAEQVKTTGVATTVTEELPPIFIGQTVPRFPVRGNAVVYSRTLYTIRNSIEDRNELLHPIAQYTDQELGFIARLLNFLYEEQQARGVIENSKVIEFIMGHTAGYRDIPFSRVLELINFFDIPDALIAITSVQPLPLPTNPAQEIEYNKQLAFVFQLARSTTWPEVGVKVGSENMWQLFGRMLYPRCNRYPEIAKMIDFVTAQRGGALKQTVRVVGRKVGSWLGAPKASGLTVQKNIEQIVLGAYMQQHPEIYQHYIKQLRGRSPAGSVIFSPDAKNLASDSLFNNIRLLNLSDGSSRELRGHTDVVWSVAFSPDGKAIVSGSSDNTIRLWSVADGSLLREFRGHIGIVRSVVFSPDGRMLASGSDDNTIRLWSVADGSLLQEFRGHTGAVRLVVFSPDGRMLASVSRDHIIRLLSVADGSLLQEFSGHKGTVWSVAFSPDGRTLASGSDDNTIRLWSVAGGSLLQEFSGHTGAVWSVAFSPDGRILASGSDDNTIRLWSVAGGSLLQEFSGHTGAVWSVAFSPDGRMLASGSWDSPIRLWGYMSLRDALQAPIRQITAAAPAPAADGSSAAPSAPARLASPR